uniref:Protein farnesyltransferase n=1 Tax=Plectus sambesii TaxID=2011161 RepID=A0A914W7J4_9BILA
DEALIDKSAEWLVSCQTYEGGFGGVQGCEAHGGYTFCGLAALTLLGKGRLAHLPSLLKWLVFKQMRYEGGFQGRSNKLVDGCYSFWQAASFPIIEMLLNNEGDHLNKCLFDNKALQEFIMICCQDKSGGLRDKPDKKRDLYHTCYTLSGLAIAQHSLGARSDIIGGDANAVLPTHPVYNIVLAAEQKAKSYFSRLETTS